MDRYLYYRVNYDTGTSTCPVYLDPNDTSVSFQPPPPPIKPLKIKKQKPHHVRKKKWSRNGS